MAEATADEIRARTREYTIGISVKEAINIKKYLRDKRLKEPAFVQLSVEKQVEHFQAKYPQFNRLYVVPLQFIVTKGWFIEKAFRRMVEKIIDDPPNDRQKFCERQADYVEYLYEESKYSPEECVAARKSVLEQLLLETEVMARAEEHVKKEADKHINEGAEERRRELKLLIELHMARKKLAA